ncbi:MAG: BlaI family transcriptional regulator [SAR86 cluster bacterium]|uniref:BlaI family transcriptional regulator n=1 Tax=SAR86 cluster bacterium TaxID=2030880 RepID=A0A2A4WX06_9GAMM|nr:MAG: BlaI family transcriptional regulator [SAR86 cluster bacterium]
MTKATRLTDQQFQVFQAVNKLGKASARQVQLELDHLALAHTTVATLLSRLEKKGLFSSEVSGRERVYQTLIEESSIRRSMVESLITTVFKGDSKALIAHLVSEGEIDPAELKELRKLAQKEPSDG